MSSQFRCYLRLSLLLCLGLPGLARARTTGTSQPDLRMTVAISNYAQLPEGMLAQAEEEAARIFRHAGVETVWLDCAPAATMSVKDPACPTGFSPTVLFVRILPRSMAKLLDLPHKSCGVAAPSSNGGFGAHAFVSVPCVQELAISRGARLETILGYMLAHEMGHLILGPGSHSQEGVMYGHWGREQVEGAIWARLRFTLREAKAIQAQVLKRVGAERAGQVARLATGK